MSESSANYVLEFSAFSNSRIDIGDAGASLNGKIRLDCKTKHFPVGANVSLISNGQILQKDVIENAEYIFDKSFSVEKDSYFRLEARDATGSMLALTNPIFVSVKK